MKTKILFLSLILSWLYSDTQAQSSPNYCPLYFEKNEDILLDELSQKYYENGGNHVIIVGNFITAGINNPDEIIFIDLSGVNENGGGVDPPRTLLFSLCHNLVGNSVYNSVWDYMNNPLFRWWNADPAVDKYIVGNFDGGSKESILCINPETGWSHLVKFSLDQSCGLIIQSSNMNWDRTWGNAGGGNIGTWNITPGDDYYAGDFNGNGTDELLCINKASESWHLYELEEIGGGNMEWNLISSGGPNLGNFSVVDIEKVAVGKFTIQTGINTTKDMLFTAKPSGIPGEPGWFGLQIFSLSANSFFGTFNNGNNLLIGTEILNGEDQFYGVQLDMDAKSELLRYNRRWRFDLKSVQYEDSSPLNKDFIVNGNVDFKGYDYTSSKNPKYASDLKLIYGRFDKSFPGTCPFVISTVAVQDFELYCPEDGRDWFSDDKGQAEVREGNIDKKNAELQIKVFPTIVSNHLDIIIESIQPSTLHFELFNAAGSKINSFDYYFEVLPGKTSLVFPVSDSPQGLYFLRVSTNKSYHVFKIIISKI